MPQLLTRVGLLLAGGRSRRMGGGDKFLLEVSGRRLMDRALERLAPQVDQVVVSAGADTTAVADCGVPIVEDEAGAGRGPLAGILAGLRWSNANGNPTALVVSVPADTPFFPVDLASRLVAERAAASAEIAIAASLTRSHHAVAAWPASLAGALEAWLSAGNSSAVRDFLSTRHTVTVDFAGPYDPFFNVNTPDDLETARHIAQTFAL